MLIEMAYSMIYGDLIVHMANQCRPYELVEGETDRRINKWLERLVGEFSRKGSFRPSHVGRILTPLPPILLPSPVHRTPKIRVGVVGEIYIKYAPLGNNNLEEFLLSEGCEPVVPGLTDFIIFKCDNRVEDHLLYGGKRGPIWGASVLAKYVRRLQKGNDRRRT